MTGEPVPITSLEEGEEGTILSITGGRHLLSRLAGMGIVSGTKVKVLRNSGGLIIILASDTRVALGRGQAAQILVVRRIKEKAPDSTARKTVYVALAGQPNVGKSTIFNVLTGLSQHIGNWPGKTVEKKEGTHSTEEYDIHIIDLPGTYSLSAFSEEERLARDFIIKEHPDIIVLIVNAAALERSLYLLAELLLFGAPVILAVNMIDVAESQGIHINIEALQRSLSLPVIPMIATKNKGIKELVSTIVKVAKGEIVFHPKMPMVSADHQEIFQNILELVQEHIPQPYQDVWVVTKLMEGDVELSETIEDMLPVSVWNNIQSLLVKHEDAHRAVVGGRYDWIENATRAAISRFKRGQVLITDHIDHILTQPVFGIPLLLGILAFIFFLTYRVGLPFQKLLETIITTTGSWITHNLTFVPPWIKGLLVDGIIGGAGAVLTFLPILIIFFAAMAFLEDVGYMARAAFVMDKLMHTIGLHGKSFLPMCVGFGCNVPSVLGSRIIESKRARLLTIILTPFIPCAGRLAAMTFIAAAIFGETALYISWSLIALNICVLAGSGIIISKLFLRGEPVPFIMELPLYHKPDLRTILLVVWNRVFAFIKKAGTVIMIFSVILWGITRFPGGTVEESILGWCGRLFQPIGAPLGLDWKMMVALISSIVAKENTIAALGILYNVGEYGLRIVLPSVINHASALSFLVVLMIFIPCVPTAIVMKQELKNWRWFITSLVFMAIVTYVFAFLVYRSALLFGI